MRTCAEIVFAVCTCVAAVAPAAAVAQTIVVAETGPANARAAVGADTIISYYRPQIAAARDGSFAVAWEALIEQEFFTRWHIGVQRYSAAGNPVGATHYFEPEIGCFALDTWLNDYQSNVELAFGSTGLLLVLMQHSGEYDIITTTDISSEVTLGVIDQNGTAVDLNPSHGNCEQWKFIFPGADEQDRPRMALTPTDNLILVADGFFGQSDLRNVGLDIYDTNLNDLVNGELIPHADPSSLTAFHAWPDIATNGSMMAAVWHRCPYIDGQGNVAECDIGAQFATLGTGGVQPIGTNVVVNAGDPSGTVNFRPSVAMNPSGASVVVWQDYRTGAQGDVFGQLFDASAQPIGANFQISQGSGQLEARPEVRPEVAMLDNGQFMVVWADTSAAGYQARGRQFDAAGSPLGPPVLLNNTPGVETGVPSVATDGTNYYFVTLGRTANDDLSVLATTPASTIGTEDDAAGESDRSVSVYPNPFRASVIVEFVLDAPSTVRVELFDVLGRNVETLLDGFREAGRQTVAVNGRRLAPGHYVIRIQTPDRTRLHKLVRAG